MKYSEIKSLIRTINNPSIIKVTKIELGYQIAKNLFFSSNNKSLCYITLNLENRDYNVITFNFYESKITLRSEKMNKKPKYITLNDKNYYRVVNLFIIAKTRIDSYVML